MPFEIAADVFALGVLVGVAFTAGLVVMLFAINDHDRHP